MALAWEVLPSNLFSTNLLVIASTPRDGSTRVPFEQDTGIIRKGEEKTGKASACGRTLAGGAIDIASGVAAQIQQSGSLPEIAPGGTFAMTLHQVNRDGAGPYTCEIDTTGTGNNFQPMTVLTNVPGVGGNSNAKATDFPLTVQIPSGITLTGGAAGNMGLIRMSSIKTWVLTV